MAILGLPNISKRSPKSSEPLRHDRSGKTPQQSPQRIPSRHQVPEREIMQMIEKFEGLDTRQREYLTAKLEIGRPGRNSHLTREDFQKLLRQMELNPNDRIDWKHVKQLREKGRELFGN